MTKSKILLFSILLVLLINACKKETELGPTNPIIGGGVPKEEVLPVSKPKGNEKYLTLNSEYIYSQEKVRTYNLIIKREDFFKLNNDPAKEEYVEAALVFEGDTISPVGVRYKGSIGAYIGCVSGTNWSSPSGNKTCTKLNMQVKVNWKDRKERFYDLNKLQFHAHNYDKSQLRERVGYWLFSQMGVPAPRSVHARLVINGEYSGLYGLTEEVDNRFAEYFYKEGKGNIYKEVWPLKATGEVQSDGAFMKGLKTNEDSPNFNIIREFGESIAKSSPSERQNVVRKYMDVDKIMAYCVVDRIIRHDDGPFHWYCSSNEASCEPHNFYWFEDKKNKKMHLIPWDMDGTFEHIIRNANSVTPITDAWGEKTNDCQPYGAFIKQRSASCDKLTAAWVSFGKEFTDLKTKFQKDILTDAKTMSQIDAWTKQIEPFVLEADKYHNNSIGVSNKATTIEEWQNAVKTLKNQVTAARDK